MKKLFSVLVFIALSVFANTEAVCAQRYRLQETIKPFSNYTSGNKEANGVFKIIDTETGDILYFKRTFESEIENTRRADQINFGPDPIIHIVKIADLTDEQIDDIAHQIGLFVPKYVRADTWLVTEKIPDGVSLLSVIMHSGFLGDDTQITFEEIDQIVRELKIMHDGGINHTDLPRNIILHRESDGKLQAYILDFEGAGKQGIDYVETELEKLKKRM